MYLQSDYYNRNDLKKNLYWPVNVTESLSNVHESLCTESDTMDRTNHSCAAANYFLDDFQSSLERKAPTPCPFNQIRSFKKVAFHSEDS